MLIIMATTMNKFTKENVLICWNSGGFASQLKDNGYNVITCYENYTRDLLSTSDKANLKQDKRKKKDSENTSIKAVVVLCELTWGLLLKNQTPLSPLSVMSGIDFVMNLRRNNYSLPILFVSFLNREQQLALSSRNEIISTPSLGNFYYQLPSEPHEWIELLNNSAKPQLSKIEMEDLKSHFCDTEGMLRELNHDLRKYLDSTENSRSEKFDFVFKKITDIVGSPSDQIIGDLKMMKHETLEEYEEKIQKIGKLIEKLILGLKTEVHDYQNSSELYQVIFLDDEFGVDIRLANLKRILEMHGIKVLDFTDPLRAYQEILKDDKNKIDIIISDHRIWNATLKPKLLDQPQGYNFLKMCVELNRTYTYVVFSALDRNFLMKHFGVETKTLYKNGVLANDSSMLNFAQNIIEWGKINKGNLLEMNNFKEVFRKCYNWYKNEGRLEEVNSKVMALILSIIDEFNLFKDKFPKDCISRSGYSCSDCELHQTLGNKKENKNYLATLTNIKAEYKLPEDWDPTNEDHVHNLIIKLAARRLYLYFFFNLKKFNCKLAEDIADNLVEHGKIRFEFDKNIGADHDPKDKILSLMDTARYIWIKKNNLHYTPEEAFFLKSCNLI